MSGSIKHWSPTPIIKFIQDLGRGRKVVPSLRYADEQAARTQPPPNIPGGPYHKLFDVYYYTRDARREVKPPILISESKQIGTENASTEKKYFTPGKPYNWD